MVERRDPVGLMARVRASDPLAEDRRDEAGARVQDAGVAVPIVEGALRAPLSPALAGNDARDCALRDRLRQERARTVERLGREAAAQGDQIQRFLPVGPGIVEHGRQIEHADAVRPGRDDRAVGRQVGDGAEGVGPEPRARVRNGEGPGGRAEER